MQKDKRVMKLCSRCEKALRRGGRLLRRVNMRPGEIVDCEICRIYHSGGYYEVGEKITREGRPQ